MGFYLCLGAFMWMFNFNVGTCRQLPGSADENLARLHGGATNSC